MTNCKVWQTEVDTGQTRKREEVQLPKIKL